MYSLARARFETDQGSSTSPGKGRKGHGRHHGPDCADGSRCVEVPVGREDEVSLLAPVSSVAAILGGDVAQFVVEALIVIRSFPLVA